MNANETTIHSIQVWRGEGPNQDPLWSALQWKTFETPDELDAKLAEVAETIEHLGGDKFDVQVVLSDGSTVEATWILERGERPAGVAWQVLEWAGKKV